MLFSVIIPLYNKEATIANTIKSVLSQSCQDFELVVVDDGSIDGSAAIVSEINDYRIRLIRQENGGPSKARNTGIKNSKGDWLIMLDADDELLPNALDLYSDVAKEHLDTDIIECNEITIVGNKKTLGYHPVEGYIANPMKSWFFQTIRPGNASAFKRKFMSSFLYDERIRRFEDAELLIRILPYAKIFSLRQPTILFNRNYAEASKPRNNVYDDYFAYLDFSQGGFWQKMCTYKLFLEERELYPEYGHQHYAKMYKRYDWLLVYKVLNWFGKYINK